MKIINYINCTDCEDENKETQYESAEEFLNENDSETIHNYSMIDVVFAGNDLPKVKRFAVEKCRYENNESTLSQVIPFLKKYITTKEEK